MANQFNQPMEGLAAGRNAVLELLKSNHPIDKIYMMRVDASTQGTLLKIKAMAAERGIPVKEVSRDKLDSISGVGINHQGVAAVGAVCEFVTIDELYAAAEAKGEAPFFILCDDIEDPHNLGAIIRSADAAGAHGIIIPKRQGVGMTPSVLKASAGAAVHLPVARVSNLAATVDELKERGAWIYCGEMEGQDWCTVDYAGAVVLVIGSEGRGVSRLLREKSDFVVSLPMYGKVNSLNASVAAAVLMYEVTRQRKGIKAK